MKVVYYAKGKPVELSEIPALLTQDTMKAMGVSVTNHLRKRFSEEELREITVGVRLKKRFFGADEVIPSIAGPDDIMEKIHAAGRIFPR